MLRLSPKAWQDPIAFELADQPRGSYIQRIDLPYAVLIDTK